MSFSAAFTLEMDQDDDGEKGKEEDDGEKGEEEDDGEKGEEADDKEKGEEKDDGEKVEEEADEEMKEETENGEKREEEVDAKKAKEEYDGEKGEKEAEEKERICPWSSCFRPSPTSVFRDPIVLLFLIFGFFHIGGIMSLRVFMPPLILESYLQEGEPKQLQLQQHLQQDPFVHSNETQRSVVDVSVEMSTTLAYYGVGGVIGNVIVGNLLTFGPLSGRNFEVYIANNVSLLVLAGQLIDTNSYVIGFGQQPRKGMKSCRMGRFFIHKYVCMYVCTL